jgi:hypothetical protein
MAKTMREEINMRILEYFALVESILALGLMAWIACENYKDYKGRKDVVL